MFRRPFAVIALSTALGLAATAPALAAAPTLDVTGAKLLARGAAVQVNLKMSCDDVNESYSDASLQVTVRQVQKKKIVEGTSYAQVNCTGTSQSRSVTVTAYNQAFTRGLTLVNATLTAYQTFEEEKVEAEVRVM